MILTVPILRRVDVLILGGSTGAVEAALAARAAGASVFLATAWTFPGEDVAATLRYWDEPGDGLGTALYEKALGEARRRKSVPTPMHFKRTLEQALIGAGVEFLYGCQPAWLVRGADGSVDGAVLANRSGFQAVVAPAIIDATQRSLAARASGARFRALTASQAASAASGGGRFRRVVVGGPPIEAPGVTCRKLPVPMPMHGKFIDAFECELGLPLPDASPAAMARAEVQARLGTWHPEQLLAADRVWSLLPDRLETRGHVDAWPGAQGVPLEALRCGDQRLFVLGPGADLSDAAAEALSRARNLMSLGRRLGGEAAALAKASHVAEPLTVDQRAHRGVEGCDVCRKDRYFRGDGSPALELDLNRLPVLGRFDVVVSGGGTAGAPAGIAAAREGVSTVILEALAGLGGVGTEGRISSYWYGNRCGFTSEIDRGVAGLGPPSDPPVSPGRWNPYWKKHWYLREADRAGAQVWFGAMTVAAAVHGGKVCGVVAATPWGFGLIRAEAVVDASGNADAAAAAGAPTVQIGREHLAVQGTGLSPCDPNQTHYQNTDHTFVDDSDVLDVTRAFAVAREKFRASFDLTQIINSRQRRQIVGDCVLGPLDFLAHRTFPDTITTASSNFDSHGFTIHPLFMVKPPDEEGCRVHVPFRSLLPRGLEGVLVTGLGMSCHRDALPVVRMQPDVQNQGYAAGMAAAWSARQGKALRQLDLKSLQRRLVEAGILELEVLGHIDSFPLPDKELDLAIAEGLDDYLGLAIIFADPSRSLARLRGAFAGAADPARRLRCAQLLGLMGDATGAETLADALRARAWDAGWRYTGMGQFGFSLSGVDGLLVALGRTRHLAAGAVLLEKLAALTPESEFSHFRAMALALEASPTAKASPLLARLLDDPAIAGNARRDLAAALPTVPQHQNDTTERNRELSEIHLARALWVCGDLDGRAARVLAAYSQDYHGHYARHARALLASEPGAVDPLALG